MSRTTAASSRRIRVLHVLPRFMGGGPERSVLNQARLAAESGASHEHTVAVLNPPMSSRLVLKARRLGIRVISRPDAATLRTLVRDTDVVQIHYWNHPLLTQLLESTELPPARVVVWAHILGTTAPQVLPAELGRFADRLVLTSPRSAASEAAIAAQAAGIPSTTIPGIIDPTRIEGRRTLDRDGRCVGYVGSVDPTKMHPQFVELAAAVPVPDARFDVYGGGSGEEVLRRQAEDLGMSDRFTLHGHVEAVGTAFAGFDVFGYPLAPDTYATSEKALQEAMWAGVPPVVLPHGGVAELVEDGVTGLVAISEQDYPAAVARLLLDSDLRRTLGSQAQRWVRSAYDPVRWARAAVGLVEDLFQAPRRDRAALPGGAEPAAGCFVRALGELGQPFAISLDATTAANVDPTVVQLADQAIAASSTSLAKGEGGVLHYRNTFPGDAHLRFWSGLILAAAGRPDDADAELRAAEELGFADGRPAHHRTALKANESR